MVKSENAELIINGKCVENGLTFTATDSAMEIQIAFTFNASELAGKELVTFEELYDVTNPDKPIKVAEHKDIEDKGQTVTITGKPDEPTTPESDTPTGKGNPPKQAIQQILRSCFSCLFYPLPDLYLRHTGNTAV